MFLLSKILSNFTPKLNKLHLTTTCPELTKLRHTKKIRGSMLSNPPCNHGRPQKFS